MPYSQLRDILVKELILQMDQLWCKTWPSIKKNYSDLIRALIILPEDGSITETPSLTAILESFLC